ncbi:glycosyltransferase family 58 protein [Xylogone sp. PMI_703]|nr:glycosyltransferase family 58 protein [Xylogone sp. PMI_703]
MADKKSPPLYMTAYNQVVDLAMSRHPLAKYIPPLLILFEALLCSLVISFIPCKYLSFPLPHTEIDWVAYMEQVEQYIQGERDYTQIKGGTGPLVYPAAHVYIYWMLYYATNRGTDILMAQRIFGVVYVVTVGIVMSCYRRAKVPIYVFPMLVLSKRLHSIFLLRCFNDAFATLALWLAIFMYQRRMWTIGSMAYSLGVGIKMSLLLALPGVGLVLFFARGVQGSLKQAWLMTQLQIVIALPFLPTNAIGYLSRAFEFSRQFLFKWTVNWRFVGEEKFLSKEFSISLLVGHLSILVVFILTRWLRTSGKTPSQLIQRALKLEEPLGGAQRAVSLRVTPDFVMATILTAIAIGMLFARSLHYQFYAYIAWATPYLLWRSGMNPILQYSIWAAQEWAWNVYPSTSTSSAVVVGSLLVAVASVWLGTANDFEEPLDETKPSSKASGES